MQYFGSTTCKHFIFYWILKDTDDFHVFPRLELHEKTSGTPLKRDSLAFRERRERVVHALLQVCHCPTGESPHVVKT
jgi:hypothetical protein